VRKKQQVNFAIITVIAMLIIAGTFIQLRTPAPKLMPEGGVPAPEAKQEQTQLLEGMPQFDMAKYPKEPVIEVWLSDKNERKSMPLETYLEGVIAKEMDPSWPFEALRAQAIASRTLTLSAMEAGTIRKLHAADVSTDKDELQAYAPEKVNNTVRFAVQSTRGEILLYGGSLVHAIYCASNGQISATKEESFPREISEPLPYFQPVTDESFQYTPPNIREWTVKVPGAEVAAAVGYQGNPANITILEKGPSGRILYIGVDNNKVYGSEFRKTIGFDRLKSTLINEMTYDGTTFLFKGRGWGNGVGLCQWGAYTSAVQGMIAEDILKHYYVGTQITKLWN